MNAGELLGDKESLVKRSNVGEVVGHQINAHLMFYVVIFLSENIKYIFLRAERGSCNVIKL